MNGKSEAREAIDFKKLAEDIVLKVYFVQTLDRPQLILPKDTELRDEIQEALRSVAEQIEEETIQRLYTDIAWSVPRLYRSEGTEQSSEGDK